MSLNVVHTKTGITIGSVQYIKGKGWYCNPFTAAHKPSRKPHDTADEAIPRWMKAMGVHIQYPPFGSEV